MDLAFVVNPEKPTTLGVLKRARTFLQTSPHRIQLFEAAVEALRARPDYAGEAEGLALVRDAASCDAIVALGGDGTLLHAVRLLGEIHKPLLGINLGSLGFLTDTSAENLEVALEALVSGRYRIDARMLLEVVLERRRGETTVLRGLNDVVVHGPRARVLHLSMRAAGGDLGQMLADGVLVATPSGSTAYSLSAGGPVVSPRLRALVVTPISPHTLSMRPLVLGTEEEIEITLRRSGPEGAELTVDGQASLVLEPLDRIRVRGAARDVQLVVTQDRNFYDTLRTKLGWGYGRRRPEAR